MEQFRITISAVFWAETPETAEGVVAAINALLPPEDQAATFATVEYVADGRPANLSAGQGVTP